MSNTTGIVTLRRERWRGAARRVWVGFVLLLAGIAPGVWIFARGGVPFTIDSEWITQLADHRVPVLLDFSFVLNGIGGGIFGALIIPAAIAVVLLLVRQWWAALFFVVAELASAGVVQVVNHLIGRPRPEDILVVSDFGSFPSGHVANAATLAVVAYILWPRVWVAVVGALWVVLMAFSRMYLGAHWLTDTVGGALIGAGVVMLVAAALTPWLPRSTAPPRNEWSVV